MKLANDDGARWHTDELKGKFALLYFGFTMCPDICPDELEKMAECVDLVEKTKQRIPIWKHQVFADGTDEWVNCA